MGGKRRATGKQPDEPAAKEAKVEETKAEEEPAKEEPKKEDVKEEPAGEKEVDDKKDTRASIKEPVCFHNEETTLNVIPTAAGRVLMSLSDGGMQFLIAGARASVGVVKGRYFFEVKVVEALTPHEGRQQNRSRLPMPRQLVRVGFSTAGSSLLLGDGGESSVGFDSEGFFFVDKKRVQASSRFGRDQALGVLLNLDAKSPNANTISLFCNGQRVSEPLTVPEKLRGQALFPHVSFRNVTLQVNFGPAPICALPFKCRMLQEAAKDDVKEVKAQVPKDGKYEVLFPVAFPDEGTFDWLDSFLEKNPQYVELSDRKIQDWAVKSGIWKPRSNSWKNSNDKPEFNFGIQYLDDFSVRRCVNSIASVVPRNYVLMEVKQNLTQAERKASLNRFRAAHFKKIAHVVMGKPKDNFVSMIQKKMLDEKKIKAEMEWKMRKLERERKKAITLRQKELAEQKAASEAKQKEAEEEEAKAKEEGEEKPEGAEEAKGEEAAKTEGDATETKEDKAEEKEETKKPEEETDKGEEKEKEEAKDEKMEEAKEEKKEEVKEEKKEEEEEEEMPEVELSEEEKKLTFRPPVTTDIASHLLSTTFDQFCIPEKSEGFDDVRFEWEDEAGSKDYLKKWIREKKITSRIEDLQPSESFRTKAAEFQKTCQEWQTKQKDFKDNKREEDFAKGGDVDKDEEEEEVKKMDVDIFSVEDVCDVGNGEPLFAQFTFEDWALLTLRFELYLLQAGFKEDVKDPERIGIHEQHLLFYYSRYFRKQLNPKSYGKDTAPEVIELVKDTVRIDPDTKVLTSRLTQEPESLGTFCKMQEESRRKRQQRIDAGDETARLNFGQLQQQQWEQEGSWPRPRGTAARGDAVTAGTTPGEVPAGPRLVPAPRAQTWQQGQNRGWQGGKSGGGRWQPTYAPRLGKGGKKN